MQLTLHATRRTPRGASRLVQAMSAWLVKTRRTPSRHSRDARVYGHTATAMHEYRVPPPTVRRLSTPTPRLHPPLPLTPLLSLPPPTRPPLDPPFTPSLCQGERVERNGASTFWNRAPTGDRGGRETAIDGDEPGAGENQEHCHYLQGKAEVPL